MGRKSKLTPEITKKIADALRAGNYIAPTCEYAGITERTFHNWMETGEAHAADEKDTDYFQFFQSVKKAQAEAEIGAVARLRGFMREDWKAIMTYLERRYPDRWGRRERHEHTGKDGGPIAHTAVDLSKLSAEELEQLDSIVGKATDSTGD